MCCLTAESHLQPDRRGPTQRRGPCCGPTRSEADPKLSAASQCTCMRFCPCASLSDMHVCLNAGARAAVALQIGTPIYYVLTI